MTAFEVLVVVACLVLLATLLLPMIAAWKQGNQRTFCVSNLRQVILGFRIWEGDIGPLYPMAVSVTNGGAMELMETGNLIKCLQCASNEMTTTKIFVCPEDPDCTFITNWNDLNRSHVSYFIDADASNEANPAMVLDGDDNLTINGKPVTSGLLRLSSNAPVFWFGKRHEGCGDIGFADGHADVEPPNGLEVAFQRTGLATNRIVIP
jgi:hypothetical protein